MNPGLSEEAGKVITSVIDGLKAQPIVFAFILINLVFLVFIYFTMNKVTDRTTAELERNDVLLTKLIDKCKS